MKHRVKLTVIDKKCYPELQEQYCANPNAGPCPCYNVGDEFIFRRDEERDDFWHLGLDAGGECDDYLLLRRDQAGDF